MQHVSAGQNENKAQSLGLGLAYAAIAAIAYIFLFVACFPPFDAAEAAYVFTLPLLIWALFKPGWRLFLTTVYLSSWASWFLIFIWLRHIHPPYGWGATAILTALIATMPLCWFAFARWSLPRVMEGSAYKRILLMLGLAGLWVLTEWVRTWLFTGCPWLPLAASQWQRPMLLVASWTGHYGIGFVLILVNLGLLFYGRNMAEQIKRRVRPPEEGRDDWPQSSAQEKSTAAPNLTARQRFEFGDDRPKGLFGNIRFGFCLEFYLALGIWFFCFFIHVTTVAKYREREPMFVAAAVQPWIAPDIKWDPDKAKENLNTLERLTDVAAILEPDVILWPEAATPFPVLHSEDANMQRWTERLVNNADTQLLAGSLAYLDSELFNGVFWVRPKEGVEEIFYLKRHPVPFGEYAPMRDWLPFIGKFVPLDNDIIAGGEAVTIPIEFNGERMPVGTLICNEDIYPRLARDMAKKGADWLLVVTNNAWYGQEAGAYQHAANSVLRAVETRLPTVRCGNHGWSGWIDEFGQVREVLTNADGTIYYQGVGPLNVSRAKGLPPGHSFYVRYGDWFVALSGLFFAGAMVVCRKRKAAQ